MMMILKIIKKKIKFEIEYLKNSKNIYIKCRQKLILSTQIQLMESLV
jgi:hypothetical protein